MGKQLPATFEKRFDFYWKSIAIYSIVLIIYSFIRSTIAEGTLTLSLTDPIVLLLFFIIVFSIIAYLYNIWKGPKIIVGKDSIILKTRFRERVIPATQIVRIQVGREIITNLRRSLKVFRIYVTFRTKPYRIRPSSFWNDVELTDALVQFKKANNK
jgi:hypothetical protein